MITRYLGFLALRATLRALARVISVLADVGLLVLALPVTLAGGYALTLAWLLGWPPRQLYRAAGWCLPMVLAWLAALAAAGDSWPQVAAAPFTAWLRMWHDLAAGSCALAAVTVAPAAIPLGLLAGGLAWSWRIYSLQTGSGGLGPGAPAAFDQRQWRHQVRTARARISAPGAVPLVQRNGSVVAGATIRTVRHRAGRLAVVPYPQLRSHQVVIGTTGTGKTTLLLRLWAGSSGAACTCTRPAPGRARCWWSSTARAAPTRGGSPSGPAGCSATPGRRPPRSGPTKPACRCGRCRRPS